MNRTFARALLALGISTGVVLGAALPAAAHRPIPAGSTECADGAQLVTWRIGNSHPRFAMTIVSARAALDGAQWPVTGYTSPVAPLDATTATTTLPGALTGSLVLTVIARWPDQFRATRTATVELAGDCAPPPTTSPPTSSPPTSSPPTSRGVSSASVVPTSTAARAGAAATTTPPQLPNTGGPAGALIALGLGVLVLGAATLAARRPRPPL